MKIMRHELWTVPVCLGRNLNLNSRRAEVSVYLLTASYALKLMIFTPQNL